MTTSNDSVSNDRKYDYPITDRLVRELKEEYEDETIDKGNSWRTEKTIEDVDATYWLLDTKLTEEFDEVRQLIDRINHSSKTWQDGLPRFRGLLQAELKDLILVASMCHERLQTGQNKEQNSNASN